MVENHEIFIPHLYLAPLQGVTALEFREDVYADKTRMIGLPYSEKKNYDNMLSRFHPTPERYGPTDRQTDRQTNGQTDGQNCYINIARQCADAR